MAFNWKTNQTGPGGENSIQATVDVTPKTRSEYTISKNPSTQAYSLTHITVSDPKQEIHILGNNHKDIPSAQAAAVEHHKTFLGKPNLHSKNKQLDLFHKSEPDLEKAEIYPYGLEWNDHPTGSSTYLPSGHTYHINSNPGTNGFYVHYRDPYDQNAQIPYPEEVPKQRDWARAFEPIEGPKDPRRISNPNNRNYEPALIGPNDPNIQVQSEYGGGFPSLHAAKLAVEDHALGPHKRELNPDYKGDYPFGDEQGVSRNEKVAREHRRWGQPIMDWQLANHKGAADLAEPEDAAMVGHSTGLGNAPFGHYSLRYQRGPLKGWTVRHNTLKPGTEGGESNLVMPAPHHETPSEGSAIFSNKHEARRAAAQHAYNSAKSPNINKSQFSGLQDIHTEAPLEKTVQFNEIREALLKSTKDAIEQYTSELIKLRKSSVCEKCAKSTELCKCDAGRVGNTEAEGSVGKIRDMQKKEFEAVNEQEALPADINPGKAPGDSKEISSSGAGGAIKSSKNLFKSIKKSGMGGGVPMAKPPSLGAPKVGGMVKDEMSMGPDMTMSVNKSNEPATTGGKDGERSVSGDGENSWSASATRGVGLKKSLANIKVPSKSK